MWRAHWFSLLVVLAWLPRATAIDSAQYSPGLRAERIDLAAGDQFPKQRHHSRRFCHQRSDGRQMRTDDATVSINQAMRKAVDVFLERPGSWRR